MRKQFILFLLLASGCQVSSRFAMEGAGGRTSYNAAIQMTNGQQMLLNLVRLRYADIPFFLDVSGVTTQFTYKAKAAPTIPIPGFNEQNPFVLGGEFSWEDQPTISYTPLEGEAFTSRLLRPVGLQTIQQLIYSGWEVDRIFRILIQNFEDLYNAPEAASPSPDRIAHFKHFEEAVSILRHFQCKGDLQIGVRVEKGEAEGLPSEQSLQIAIPDQGAEAARFLELIPAAKRKGGKVSLSVELGFDQKGRLGLLPRSILACMYYLSQAVAVPDIHVASGWVSKPIEEGSDCWSSSLQKLLSVHSSFTPPQNAYLAVKYKQIWYYILDCDLASKKTFALLLQLYNLHAEEVKSAGPILTLPLG